MIERDPYAWIDPVEETASVDALLGVIPVILARARRPDAMRGKAIHHIDGDPNNNDLSNLRLVEITENTRGKA